jgi:hypothetical protein
MRSLSIVACMAVLLSQWIFPGTVSASSLNIGIPEGLPGYELLPNGDLQISVPAKRKLTDCIEKNLKARFVWQAYPTKRVIFMLTENKLDLIYPMGFTDERAATMLQSAPTWQNPDTILSMRSIDMRNKNVRIVARLGSPQHTDYVADGYSRVATAVTYEELAKTLLTDLADVVIVPQSVYEEQKDSWPANTFVTLGKARKSGFYLNKDDPKRLLAPLNRSIERCKAQAATVQ